MPIPKGDNTAYNLMEQYFFALMHRYCKPERQIELEYSVTMGYNGFKEDI